MALRDPLKPRPIHTVLVVLAALAGPADTVDPGDMSVSHLGKGIADVERV